MNYEKLYKDTLKKVSELYRDYNNVSNMIDVKEELETIFPELRKSDDERIRKWLLDFVQGLPDGGLDFHFYNLNKEQVIAWLEKQGEQKSADKVEPKFKVGDTMRTLQEANDGYTDGMPVVVSIDNEYYHCTNELIAIKDQDDYEFPPINVKQKSAEWSEEDKKMYLSIIEYTYQEMPLNNKQIAWLVSVKQRMEK